MKKRNQRGSVTIEATIALTAFLFMFMMLYSVITICRAEAKIGVAVNNAAKELSQYSYVYSLTGLNESEAAINTSAQGTEDDINGAVGNIADTFDAMQTLRTDGENMIDKVSSGEEQVEQAINIDYNSWDTIITQLENTTQELTVGAEQIGTDVDTVLSSGKEVQMSLEAMADNPKELMFGIAKIFAVKAMDVAKSNLIAAPVSRALVKKNLKRSPSDNVDNCLQALGVVPGKNFFGEESYIHGLDFSHSLLYPEGQEDIIIIVKYKLKLFKYLPLDIEFDITQVAATKGWFKGDGKTVDKVESTAVAEDATVPGETPTTPGETPTLTPTPTPTINEDDLTEGEVNSGAIGSLTEAEKAFLIETLKTKYGDDIDRIYQDYGVEALYLIDKYGEDAYLAISIHGADSIRVIRDYGTDAITVIVECEADYLEVIEMITKYGQDAIDILKEYKADGLLVLYEYGDELIKLDAAGRMAFIEEKLDAGTGKLIDPKVVEEILTIEKGLRPNPSTYLPKEYITNHLAQFEEGVTKITWANPTRPVGPPGGTFVMPKSVADDIIAEAGGDVRKLEELLGLKPGDLGDSPVRIDIAEPTGLRMPDGNEPGANDFWLPGGYTSGGISEATIDQVPLDKIVVTNIMN